MSDVIEIKDTDVVEFAEPIILQGTFDNNAISYRFKVTGTITGGELRGALEHASSFKVRIRKIKDNLRDMTFGTLLASLGESSISASEALKAAEEYARSLEEKVAALEKQLKAA